MLVCQHFFEIKKIAVGQVWAPADGADCCITVTYVNYERQLIGYKYGEHGFIHYDDVFKFQTRYCMVVE